MNKREGKKMENGKSSSVLKGISLAHLVIRAPKNKKE
jgi:hypothetical protein